MKEKIHDYTLRFGITSVCNIRCNFCNKDGKWAGKKVLPKELSEILKAAYQCGIRRVHFTGGEPLMCDGLEDVILDIPKDYEVIFTTNGVLLDKYSDAFKKRINRINFSLESIYPSKQAEETNMEEKIARRQIENLKEISSFVSLTKLNMVALREVNLNDLPDTFEFCQEYGIVYRMMELQEDSVVPKPESYFEKNLVLKNEIIDKFERLGKLKRTFCKGDNFCTDYYLVGESNVPVGVMYFVSLNFRCPGERCKAIFVNTRGRVTACKSEGFNIEDFLMFKSFEEKVRLIEEAISVKDKMNEGEISYPEYHVSNYPVNRGGFVSVESSLK